MNIGSIEFESTIKVLEDVSNECKNKTQKLLMIKKSWKSLTNIKTTNKNIKWKKFCITDSLHINVWKV